MSFYATSDWHIGHEKIRKECNRPFKNVDHMTRELIDNTNEIVKHTDTLFFIGDIFWFGATKKHQLHNILNYNINCQNKILILGNHDRMKVNQYLDCGFNSVHSSVDYTDLCGYSALLIHNPFLYHPWQFGYKNYIVHGHMHNVDYKVRDNWLHIGVDKRGFKPICIDFLNQITR